MLRKTFNVSFIVIVCLVFAGQVMGDGPNILPNPSFEEEDSGVPGQPSHWQPWGTWGFDPAWDNTNAHSGSHSVELMALRGNGTDGWIMLERVPVNAATNYRVSVWVKEVNCPAQAKIQVPQFDSGGGWLGNVYVFDNFVGTNDWHVVSGVVALNPVTAQIGEIQVSYRTLSTPPLSSCLWFDDISIATTTAPVCDNPPTFDYNGDCKVDFADFAIFAANWLSCGYSDPSSCN